MQKRSIFKDALFLVNFIVIDIENEANACRTFDRD